MTTIIEPPKPKTKPPKPIDLAARRKLAAATARAERALATKPVEPSPYAGQPGASVLEPMLGTLKAMRRHLAEDWPKANLHDLNFAVRFGHCTQAEADREQAEHCRKIGLRLAEFDRAIGGIQALLDLGSPIG